MKNLILFLTACILGLSANAQETRLKDNLIQKDIRNFRLISTFFESENILLSSMTNLPDLKVREKVTTWEGCFRYKLHQSGGYVSTWITVLTKGDSIIACRMRIYRGDLNVLKKIAESDDLIRDQLDRNWRPGPYGHYHQYDFTNPRLVEKYKQLISGKLGNLDEAEALGKTKEAYDILLDPVASYDYGYICYAGGTMPEGRKAIRTLISAGRVDLIRNVIKGYNPEGRTYGIEGLLTLLGDQISEKDWELIQTVINLDYHIKVCRGCSISTETPGLALGIMKK